MDNTTSPSMSANKCHSKTSDAKELFQKADFQSFVLFHVPGNNLWYGGTFLQAPQQNSIFSIP